MHYLPLSPAFFAILVALFLVLVALIQVGILRYAYMRLGVSSGAALSLLLASLIGSYVNIPLIQLPEQHILSGREVWSFGVPYSVPVVVDWPGTVIAINVGGALIPTLMSLYLLAKNQVWGLGLIATACVAAVCYWLAQPVPGVGIALPTFVPAGHRGHRRVAALAPLRGAARLYRRQHGHADRSRPAQPRRHSGTWSTGRFDRRSRDLRRHLSHCDPGGADRGPFPYPTRGRVEARDADLRLAGK
jgi:hypothetical protein